MASTSALGLNTSPYIKPFGIIATVISGMQAGANLDISLVGIPTVLAATTAAAQVDQWRVCYDRGFSAIPRGAAFGALLHATNAYLAYSSGSTSFMNNKKALYYAGAALLQIGFVPFTLLFILPTNHTLFKIQEDFKTDKVTSQVAATVPDLIKKWSLLNGCRALFGIAAAVTALYASWE